MSSPSTKCRLSQKSERWLVWFIGSALDQSERRPESTSRRLMFKRQNWGGQGGVGGCGCVWRGKQCFKLALSQQCPTEKRENAWSHRTDYLCMDLLARPRHEGKHYHLLLCVSCLLPCSSKASQTERKTSPTTRLHQGDTVAGRLTVADTYYREVKRQIHSACATEACGSATSSLLLAAWILPLR